MVKLPSVQINRPWTIVRILPDARHYTVARFRNRQDANDHLRLLRRFIPAAKFEIIFAPLEEKEQDNPRQFS
jgi:putative acetyltransferase